MEEEIINSYQTTSPSLIQPLGILLIGSSTGGLNALVKLFSNLRDKKIGIPILITQHIPDNFDQSFVNKIEQASGLPCKLGEDGEEIQNGHVYLAPSGIHMIIEQRLDKVIIKLDDSEDVNYCKPAVDPMLFSACKIYGKKCFSVILTGIGSDGLLGSEAIHNAGGTVIAQNKESSVVWGMPGAVAKKGICSAILDIDEIANFLQEYSFGKIR